MYVRSLRFNNLSLNPPVDAVQEVSLLRNSFSTEYGQGQAVVSIVTKSGTNELHGSGYGAYRNERFDARNFFAPTKPDYKRNQFGATAGGPIVHNKFFVFGAYEGLRTVQGQPFLGSVPSQAFLSGNFSALPTPIRDPLTASRSPATLFRSSGSRILRASWADHPGTQHRGCEQLHGDQGLHRRCGYGNGTGGPVNKQQSQPFPAVHVLQGIPAAAGRVHVHRPAAKGTEPGARAHLGNLPVPGERSARWIQLRLPPERAGESRRPQLDERSGLAQPRGGDVSPRLWASGLRPRGFSGQGEGGNTQGATENIFSVSNATSKTFGGHTLRFGLQAQFRKFEHLTDNSTRGNFTFNGNFTGNSVADFLLGYCSTCAGAFGNSGATSHSPTIAPFIDDNWRVSDKLSLQLGLRWEYLAPWAEQNGVEAAFDAATGKIG